MTVVNVLLGVIGFVLAVAAGWRWASRRRHLPCPAWLAWMLENPFIEAVASTRATLDRIGVQAGDRCLDVGSGPGRLSIPAAGRVGPNGTVVAVDVQREMLARLARRAAATGVKNIRTKLCDMAANLTPGDASVGEASLGEASLTEASLTEASLTEASLTEASFDRAWLVTVLGEISDRRAALQNLYRLLKPGGILSITEIFPDPHYQRHAVVLRLCQEAGFEPTQYWGGALTFTQNFVKSSGTGAR